MKKILISIVGLMISSLVFSQKFDKDTTYYISNDKPPIEENEEEVESNIEKSEDKTETYEAQTSSYEIKTLLSPKEKGANGGFGALMFNYTSMNGQDALIGGVRGGWILNHVLAIGLGGYGLMTGVEVDSLDERGKQMYLGTGYGGLYFEVYIASRQPVHLTIPVLIGAGGATYYNNYNVQSPREPGQQVGSGFFVLEPGIHLEANITKAFRISAGANYRYTNGLDIKGIDGDALNGWSTGITFKFGKF